MMWNKQAAWETAQELVRIVFFAAISAAINFGLTKLGLMNQTDATVVLGTLALKAVDKYIHDNPNLKINGLTDTKMVTSLLN